MRRILSGEIGVKVYKIISRKTAYFAKVFNESTSFIEGTEFSGTIKAADGVMTVNIEYIYKISGGIF